MSRIQQHLLSETMCIAAVAARAALWNDNFNDNHEITQRRSESIYGEDPAVTSCSPGIARKRRNMGASCGLSSAEQQLPRRSKAGRIDRCRTKSANRQRAFFRHCQPSGLGGVPNSRFASKALQGWATAPLEPSKRQF
jgi:hypothetical protein